MVWNMHHYAQVLLQEDENGFKTFDREEFEKNI